MKGLITFVWVISISFLFSQEDKYLDVDRSKLATDSVEFFKLQDVFVGYGESQVSLTHFSNEHSVLLVNSINETLVLDNNFGSTQTYDSHDHFNLNAGASFLLHPKKWEDMYSLRFDLSGAYGSGSFGHNQAFRYDTIFQNQEIVENVILDSVVTRVHDFTLNAESFQLNFSTSLSIQLFTTLGLNVGVGGGIARTNNGVQYNRLDILDQVVRDTTGARYVNLGSPPYYDEISEQSGDLNQTWEYLVYAPISLDWTTGYYNNFFRHIVVSFDYRFGYLSTSYLDQTNWNSFHYRGIRLKYRF